MVLQMRTPFVDRRLTQGGKSSPSGLKQRRSGAWLMSFVWLICCASSAIAPSAEAAEPIRIGAVLPFSGGVELYGAQAKLGIELAVKEINAGGGILGRPVEVIYEDDQ